MNIKELLVNHVKSRDLISLEELSFVYENHPDFFIETIGYRVLLFSTKEDESSLNISDDVCFAKNIQAVKDYAACQDCSHYKFAILFKVHGSALDVSFCINKLKIRELKNIVDREQEILMYKKNSCEIIFNGSLDEFFKIK